MIELNLQEFGIGEHRAPCPECGRGGRDKTLGIKVDIDGATCHCFRCGLIRSYREKSSNIRRAPRIPAPSQNAPKRTTLSDWGQELWQSTLELSGVAVAYLEHRHCVVPPAYGDLRWHPALKHPSGHVGPALVALITDIHSNEPLSLHRTWITAISKADVNPPRLLLANHAIQNGCIKLWPPEEVNCVLGAGEGVESALSMAWCVQPVWALIDAGHLAKFPVLAGITELYIGMDNDAAGIAASTTCAARWRAAGRRVELSQQQKNDLNDEVGRVYASSN